MCDYCDSCCCDDDLYIHSWDEFSDTCDVCNNIYDDFPDCNSVNFEDNADCCGICDICGCEFCDSEQIDLPSGPNYCNSFNNIQYRSDESVPEIQRGKFGVKLIPNYSYTNKKKHLKLFKKDFCCFSNVPKSNIFVLPLAEGSKSVEIIANSMKPKSKSAHGSENPKPTKKNRKLPKLKISTPK